MTWIDNGSSGLNIPDGLIFNLKFKFKGGNTSLCLDSLHSTIADFKTRTNDIVMFNCGYVQGLDECSAAFSISEQMVAYTYNFSNYSTGYNITGWQWNFGDNTTSTKEYPSHTYADTGIYNVCLKIISTYQGQTVCSDSICQTLHIVPFQCHANIYYTLVNPEKYTYWFNNNPGQDSSHYTNYYWNFGDNNDSTISTMSNVYHSYNQPGKYNVCLTVSTIYKGDTLCSATSCDSVTVKTYIPPPPPTGCHANFYVDGLDSTVQYHFIDNSTGADINGWLWNFGDSTTASVENPVHQFSKSGNYYVCLTVTSTDSGKVVCSDTYCQYVHFQLDTNQNHNTDQCLATFYDLRDTAKYTYNFFGNGYGNKVTGYSWDFGDGNTSGMQNPVHKFFKAGDYSVCLTISSLNTDNTVCSNTYCETVNIDSINIPPNYCYNYFTYYITDTTNSTLTVNLTAFIKGSEPLAYEWNFGDKTDTTVDVNSITHIFKTKGSFNVCLKTYTLF